MKPTQQQIADAAERAAQAKDNADAGSSRYPAMTYEDGLRDALDWASGLSDNDPTEDILA